MLKELESVQILKSFDPQPSSNEFTNTMVSLVFKDENPIATEKQKVTTTIPVGFSIQCIVLRTKI